MESDLNQIFRKRKILPFPRTISTGFILVGLYMMESKHDMKKEFVTRERKSTNTLLLRRPMMSVVTMPPFGFFNDLMTSFAGLEEE